MSGNVRAHCLFNMSVLAVFIFTDSAVVLWHLDPLSIHAVICAFSARHFIHACSINIIIDIQTHRIVLLVLSCVDIRRAYLVRTQSLQVKACITAVDKTSYQVEGISCYCHVELSASIDSEVAQAQEKRPWIMQGICLHLVPAGTSV